MFLLRGTAAILFGILAIIWPGVTVLTLVLLYGIFALTDGVVAIAGALRGSDDAPRWWLAMIGILGIGAGVVTLVWPGISSMILMICIAIWAIATGIMQIIAAIWTRHVRDDEWLLIAIGALSVVFGTLLLTRPGAGVRALVFFIAAYAIMYGVLLVALSLRLRRYAGGEKPSVA